MQRAGDEDDDGGEDEDMSSTYGNAVGILLADALGLGLALLEGVLVLELATHDGGRLGTKDTAVCLSLDDDAEQAGWLTMCAGDEVVGGECEGE